LLAIELVRAAAIELPLRISELRLRVSKSAVNARLPANLHYASDR
jgi:hypothetical protein